MRETKKTMSGAAPSSTLGAGACCPVLTTVDKSIEEIAQPDFPEIKCVFFFPKGRKDLGQLREI